MSRITLSKYDDGSTHVVVGWDHPAGGAFWQEWASKTEVRAAEKWLAEMSAEQDGTEEYYLMERITETEVKREGGMWPGIKLENLIESMPEELRHLITPEVLSLLKQHSEDPDSGYVGNPGHSIDLTT